MPVHHHPELAIFQSQWPVSVTLGSENRVFSFPFGGAGQASCGLTVPCWRLWLERGSRPGWVFNVTILLPLPSQAL